MRRLLPLLPLGILLSALPIRANPPEPLPEADPLTFLEKCLERHDQSGIKGYTCLFDKRERIDGKLQPAEKTEVSFREKPHSVYMKWVEGQRRASCVLFVEGENDNMMLAKPTGLAGRLLSVVSRDPEGSDVKSTSRYSLKTFGVKNALLRTLDAWKAARDKGTLRVEYLGVEKVREAGDRPCYVLRRTYAAPEEDGVVRGTFYIDKDTWMQVGSVLEGEGDKLIASYYFRDIKVNPDFRAEQFTRAGLSQ